MKKRRSRKIKETQDDELYVSFEEVLEVPNIQTDNTIKPKINDK